MTLFGLTGTLGAGKGTVVEYLKKKGFKYFSVSDFLAEVARERGTNLDRVTLRDVGNEFRAQGPTSLMEAMFKRVEGRGDKIIVESQHTPTEVKFIQEKEGKVIAVDADFKVRYDRIQKRGSVKDNVSFEEFSEHQKQELKADDPNKNNLGAAMAVADFHITNNGTLEELHGQVDQILEKIGA